MTEGRHFWEVEITADPDEEKHGCTAMLIGAVRPELDHDKDHINSKGTYFMWTGNGSLCGSGKGDSNGQPQGKYRQGDRVGMLLDLDAGWLRFYRNGERWGPGYTKGVTGPLVRAAEVRTQGCAVTALSGAVAPDGAGAAEEPWEPPPGPPMQTPVYGEADEADDEDDENDDDDEDDDDDENEGEDEDGGSSAD